MSVPACQIRYGNRIIQQKEDTISLQKHYNSLRRARPMTGNTWQRDTIQINNKKRDMLQQNRFTEIERQNRMLFHKITSIMNKSTISQTIGSREELSTKMNKTLNGGYRKKQLQNIEVENAKMLRRLKQRKSQYQTSTLNRQWQKKKQVIKKMSLYPFSSNDISGIRRQKASNQFMSGHKNGRNQIRRIRKINGLTFLITIKFQQDRFYIIGDLKEQQNIKIIQLQRREGEEFIAEECGGNIQKVVDLLRYDRETGDLYLVGRDVGELDEIKRLEVDRKYQRVDRERTFTQDGSRANFNAKQKYKLHRQYKTAYFPPRQFSEHLSASKKANYSLNENEQQSNNRRIVDRITFDHNSQSKYNMLVGNNKEVVSKSKQSVKQKGDIGVKKGDIGVKKGRLRAVYNREKIEQCKDKLSEWVRIQLQEPKSDT